MKLLAALAVFLALPLAAQDSAAAKAPAEPVKYAAPSLNALKVQNSNLAIQNAQLASRVDGLQKEVESLRNQLVQIHTNALVSDVCGAAGIKPQECSVSPDGTVSKLKPPEEPAKAEETGKAEPATK